MARMTLTQIRERTSTLNGAALDAQTEDAIRGFTRDDGMDPDGEPRNPQASVLPEAVRNKLSMSQAEFATALRVPLAVLQDWEAGRVRPDPGARSLLLAVFRDPAAVLAAIAA